MVRTLKMKILSNKEHQKLKYYYYGEYQELLTKNNTLSTKNEELRKKNKELIDKVRNRDKYIIAFKTDEDGIKKENKELKLTIKDKNLELYEMSKKLVMK
jgi:hypothetical protein